MSFLDAKDRFWNRSEEETGLSESATIPSVAHRGRLRWGLAAVALALTLALTACAPLRQEMVQIQAPNISIYYRTHEVPTMAPLYTERSYTTSPAYQTEFFLTGVNMVNALSWSSADLDLGLTEIQKMKGSLVRLFVANNQVSDMEASQKLGVFLEKAARYNISAIPVFIDYHGGPWDQQNIIEAYINASCPENGDRIALNSESVIVCGEKNKSWTDLQKELLLAGYGNGHNPEGTDEYYVRQGNYGVLGKDFFTKGRDRFKSFIKTVITENKYHPNIYAWEVGNELRTEPEEFINFMQDITSYIRSVDPSRKIASGMADTRLTGLTPEGFYPRIPDLDVITVHPYDGDRGGAADVRWATTNGKIALVEEIGFSRDGDRSDKFKNEIAFWQSLGTSGVLPWGFVPKDSLLGNSGDRGFNAKHQDYDQISSVLKSFATR